MTAPTRNSVIRQALEQRSQGRQIPMPPFLNRTGQAAQVIRSTPRDEQRVGGMAKLFKALPKAEQAPVIGLVREVSHQLDLGRHGNADEYLKERGVSAKCDRDLVLRVQEGLATDRMAYELGERMGTDASRPLPELTRADVLSAALDAHTTKE